MKLVIFSDTHGCHESLNMPEGDMVIFAGDMCAYGRCSEARNFIQWFERLDYKYRIYIAGNHDWPFYKDRSFGNKNTNSDKAIYLEDEAVEIEGLKIYGSPWQPEFCDWAFNLKRGEQLYNKWKMIPDDTNILITHGPPATIRDCCPLPVGCDDLLSRVKQVKPDLHIFGHIHTQWGMSFRDGITFVNGSIVDDWNAKQNEPIALEI